MFAHLISQLNSELRTVEKVLAISERLRDLLVSHDGFLSQIPADLPTGADQNTEVVHALGRLTLEAPKKLDWQVYDHCAAFTRIYAAYERFVSDLVAEYVEALPDLYPKYSDLPHSITKQHRFGIGHILRKMGTKGPYQKLEEQIIVGQLASSLSGNPGYRLILDAFFIDRQNLRYEMLARLFGSLGFHHCGRYINKHRAVIDFIAKERGEASSAERELHNFIEYRNEAAHKRVENVLSKDEIGATARFISAIGRALADMVEEAILGRHVILAHYSPLLVISETHYKGRVVVGTPSQGVNIRTGDAVIIYGGGTCRAAIIEGIQLQGQPTGAVICDGATEVGLSLDKATSMPGELRRLCIPKEASKQIELPLEDAFAVAAGTADTDVSEFAPEDAASGESAEEEAPGE